MDDLTVARHCAKAMEVTVITHPDGEVGYADTNHNDFWWTTDEFLTDPAIAFRLIGWLAERGFVYIQRRWIHFELPGSTERIEEPYTTHADRIAAVARIVARVMEGQG